jgi:adenosylcobinamide-GDP ribazoletransferase
MRSRLADEWAVFAAALQFMTRLPVPRAPAFDAGRLAASSRWYPGVGLVVGAIAAAVFALAALVYPPLLAALLSTLAGLFATGCLHEDGFADVCDGLGGGSTPERALEIMRDSRLGTYGAAGLGLMLGGKILALAALPQAMMPAALLAGHAASRAACVVVIATSCYVRPQGTGRPVAAGPARGGLALALAVAVLALVGLGAAAGRAAFGAALGLVLGYAVMRRLFERRLGGYTGDCLGAVQQTSEIGLYLGLLACV